MFGRPSAPLDSTDMGKRHRNGVGKRPLEVITQDIT